MADDPDQYAFDAPAQTTAFGDADQAAQNQSQIQQGFDQARGRANYIRAIAKGASTRQGAVRSGITGNG